MSARGTTFMGFGIRIDIMSQAAIFAFKQLTTRALVFVAAISQTADELLKFEKVMADLSRLMVMSAGTTANLENRMASLGTQIIQVSNESIFGFEQIAEALSYLMRAGFTSAEAMDELAKSMQLATAVGMELAEASRTIVRLTNMFAYAGQDTSNIVDQLAQSEIMFAMTTEDMNTALNMSGAVAAEAGLSLAQLATALGVLYSAGLNASTAGTVMRRALASVLAITGGTEEAIIGLGINMEYFSSLLPLDRLKLLAQYITAIEAPQHRLNVAFEIFGIRGVNILPVLESMMVNFDALALTIQTAEGIANLAAQTFKDQLYTQLTMLSQQIQNTIVDFGIWTTSSAPSAMSVAFALTSAIYLLTSAKTGFNLATRISLLFMKLDYISSIRLSIAKFREAIATHGLASAIGWKTFWQKISNKETYKGILQSIAAVPKKIAEGVANIFVAGTYGILSLSIKIATTATKAFFKALGPIGLVLTIIASIFMVVRDQMGGMKGLMEQFRPIINQFTQFFKFLGEIIMEIAKAIMPLISILMKSLMVVIKILLIPLRILMVVFKILVIPLVIVAKVIGAIAEAFSNLIEKTGIMTILMDVFSSVMKFIWMIISKVLNVYIRLANAIIKIINRFKKEKIEEIELVSAEGLEGEMSPETEPKKDVGEPPPPDTPDETVPPEGMPTPPGRVEPTGRTDEPVRRGGDGGKGGGSYSFLLNVYIIPEMAEFWNEMEFGESLAERLALEMKSRRGVYLS